LLAGCAKGRADDTASGATRVGRSLNFKDKYAPPSPASNQPRNARLITDAVTLDGLGLVAASETAAPHPGRVSSPRRNRKWPSYQRCVLGAPENRDKTGPDVSRADFTWCHDGDSRGAGASRHAERLMEESVKARENGDRYAQMTAQNAAAAVERRKRNRA